MDQITFTARDLRARYEEMASHSRAECHLTTELVGGVPADEGGMRRFVEHHLGLKGADADAAVHRIKSEEMGERDVAPEGGELEEKLTHGINIIRRDKYGPFLGNWMPKANLKAAASRLGIFVAKKGAKGDMAEMGEILACGISLKDPACPWKIYLTGPDGEEPAETYFQTFRGRVNTPTGSKSIVNDAESVKAGARFEFEFRYYPGKISMDDLADMFAAAMVIGLGSCKAYERGKYQVDKLTYQAGTKRKGKEEKKAKEEDEIDRIIEETPVAAEMQSGPRRIGHVRAVGKR